jgi:hypothetical protein
MAVDPEACFICGAALLADGACGSCQEREREEQRVMYARYAVRADDPARVPMMLEEAAMRVSEHLGAVLRIDASGDEGTFDSQEALEAATWWYVPYSWIGCAGFVVEKATGQVHRMGSNAGLDTYLWAQARGLLWERADLVIDAVRDRDVAIRWLRRVVCVPTSDHHPLYGPGAEELATMLADLPLRFRAQQIGLWLPDLRAGIEAGAFACHLEPATAVPLAAGAWHVVLDVAAIRAVAADRGLCERLLDRVHERRLEIDATWGLRQLAIYGDGDPLEGRPLTPAQRVIVREQNRRFRQRQRVPARMVGTLEAEPRDEAAELAATFAAGGASVLVTADVASAPAFGRRVIDLAALIAYVDEALG